jgi:hypothetical protein
MTTWNDKQAAKARQRRDSLAQLVADGSTVTGASRALGMSPAVGRKMWQRVCRDLGWQAS